MRVWSVLLFLATGATLTLAQSSTPSWRFEPIQPELFATGTTLVNAAADYDGAGDVELFVGFNGTPNQRRKLQELILVASAFRRN